MSTKRERIAELARQNPAMVLTSLNHYLDEEWLRYAYELTRKDGAVGIDGQTAAQYEEKLEENLCSLLERIKSGRYHAPPVRRVYIPKADGAKRPLGIPTFEDKVAQRAIVLLLEPIYEQTFFHGSFGFRPGRSAHQALQHLRTRILKNRGYWVLDVDVRRYFETIDHGHLRDFLARRVVDGVVRRMIDKWLKAGVLEEEQWRRTEQGTPQGGVISPLLANIYLHPLDLLMEESGYRMVRYADDFVILCRTEDEAMAALRQAEAWVTENGLTLHPDKTRIGDSRQPGQGFDFLGYRFEAGYRFVRKKSRNAFKSLPPAKAGDKVRAKTGRCRGVSLGRIIADLNPMLRGWFGYFQYVVPSELRALDGFIRRRLRAILRKQEKRPGFGRNLDDHQRWPNTFFAEHGLFTLTTAHYHARHSR